MSRTLFTTTDIRNIISNIFNGNLEASRKNPSITYSNPNSEKILLVADDEEQKELDLAQYLNIKFYTWKNRVVSKNDDYEQPPLSNLESWVNSLNYSMNESYALVETTGNEATASQDIDSATISGRITFIIQTNKVNNLDYYVAKIRNNFLGVPQDIQNSYGDIIKAYINFNILTYDSEPMTIQYGECVSVSLKFKIAYLTEALNYNDTPMYLSLDSGVNYYQIPYIKTTWQNIFIGQSLPTQGIPNRTGLVNSSMAQVKTLAFYDFNKVLTMAINDLFWRVGAYAKKEATDTTPVVLSAQSVNIPVYIKVVSNGVEYYYRDVIKSMQKDITNSDFNVSSITLQGFAKRQAQ